MIIFFILGVLLGIAVVFFVIQNSAIVAVTFFSGQIEGSLSVILALSVLSGIFITLLLTLPELISGYFALRRLKRKNSELSEELRKQKELTLFAKKAQPTGETIAHIEESAIQHDGTHERI